MTKIRQAGPSYEQETVQKAAECKVRAFSQVESDLLGCGGDLRVMEAFAKMNISRLLEHGEVYFAEDTDGNVVGMALWKVPAAENTVRPGEDYQSLDSWKPVLEMIPPELSAWWINELIPSHARFTTSSFGSDSEANSWYLQSLCVDPSHQGKGLSRKLMEPVLKKAVLQGQGVSLVTSGESTRSMYAHMGFKVKGESKWNPPGGTYTCWAMYLLPDASEHGTASV